MTSTPRIALLLCLVAASSQAYEPPLNLKWGMTFETAKQVLAGQGDGKIKISKKFTQPTNTFYPNHKALKGYQAAEIAGVKLLDKKIEDGWLAFTPDRGLVLLQYNFWFFRVGAGPTWTYYLRLKDALRVKYGEPISDEVPNSEIGKEIAPGFWFRVKWHDPATDDEITIVIGHRDYGGGLAYYQIVLQYNSPGYTSPLPIPSDSEL